MMKDKYPIHIEKQNYHLQEVYGTIKQPAEKNFEITTGAFPWGVARKQKF